MNERKSFQPQRNIADNKNMNYFYKKETYQQYGNKKLEKICITNANNLNNKAGITLIALVISIIVMLILAGVSLNATIGDNGIITQAQNAKIVAKIVNYKEEMETNFIGEISNDFNQEEIGTITVLNNNVKKYITSLDDDDIGKYGIVNGELYYLGNDTKEMEICKQQGIHCKTSEMSDGDFLEQIEQSALESLIKKMAGKSFSNKDDKGNDIETGIKLYDKNFENGNKWKIINEVVDNKVVATYGNDWYYVEAGNNIENIGKLQSSYIINYKTNKAVLFNTKKHTILAYGGNLAVTDNLIFNADPINIENASTEAFGENVELIGFDNINNAFTKTSFIFDGVDDYIKLPYNKDNGIENGFTYEFYGKILNKKTCIDKDGKIYSNNCNYGGLFGLWNGNEKEQARLRFGIMFDSIDLGIYYNVGMLGEKVSGSFSRKGSPWNQAIYPKNLRTNTDIYFTISVDANSRVQDIYVNGEKNCTGTLSENYYKDFVKKELANLNTYILGRCSMDNEGNWHYTNCEIYSLRLYNRSFEESEVLANYNATVAYHNILVNNGNASTGGTTGGEDLDNINNN